MVVEAHAMTNADVKYVIEMLYCTKKSLKVDVPNMMAHYLRAHTR